MTKLQKQNKLGNAIRRYRGSKQLETRGDKKVWVWKYAPQVKEAAKVLRWLKELNIPAKAMNEIDSFKSVDEYREWIKSV